MIFKFKANEEHLAILSHGVEVWNKWRYDNLGKGIVPVLWYANLSGYNLSETNFIDAKLSGANFSDADLRWADLRYAKLNIGFYGHRTNLQKANLSGANLYRTELICANLTNANLSRAYLHKADLSGADLSGANLSFTDLSDVDLSGANLSGADLSDTNLSGAQVLNANFDDANLTGACIKNWNINSDTKLDEVVCKYVYTYNEIYDFDDDEETRNLKKIKKQQSRRPINGNFEPGEFARLYKKIIENTDLILSKTPEIENTANNQGVQFFSNQTIHTWEKLRFRSKTEIKIAEALDRAGVLFLPNSLARLNTPNGRENKEADFLVCYNGKWGVLEVDGQHHTAERRVEEQERERIFKKNGIKVVERFDAARCYQNPDEVVQEFFKMIEIGYS